jgi:hypothetical protein
MALNALAVRVSFTGCWYTRRKVARSRSVSPIARRNRAGVVEEVAMGAPKSK